MTVLSKLKFGIILFWAMWFSLAALSNIIDLFNQLGWIAANWQFISHNFALIQGVVSIYGLPIFIVFVMFIAVIIWECLISVMFWMAAKQFYRSASMHYTNLAFTLGIFLWAAFLVMEEIFIAYSFEQMHLRLLVAQLICLMAMYLLPEGER